MKRALYIVLIVLACTLMTLVAAVALVQSGRVQTAVTRYLTVELSRGLHTEVKIDRVKLHLLNRLDVYGIYMSDQAGDTLLYVNRVGVSFNPFALREDQLLFPFVEVVEPYVYIKQDTASTNIDFLLRAFASNDTTHTDFPFILSLDEVTVSDARFRYNHLPSGRDVLISRVNTDFRMPYFTSDSIDARLNALRLRMQLNGVNAYAEGEFYGSLDTVVAQRLEIVYRGQRMLLGRVDISEPLNLQKTEAKVDCQDLYCNQLLLQDLLSEVLAHPVHLPQELNRLGDVHYRGILQGRLENLVLNGVFITDLGSVTTDCILQADTSFADIRMKGKLTTKRFRLGRLFPGKQIGNLSFTADVDTRYRSDKPWQVNGKVRLDAFTYKRYTYRGLTINGKMADNIFVGKMRMKDNNLAFNFDGTLDFSNADMPKAECNLVVDHLRLGDLHLIDGTIDQDLRFMSSVKLSAAEGDGLWVDRLQGQVWMDSLWIANRNQTMQMEQMLITLTHKEKTTLIVHSDYLTARMTGDFRWSALPYSIQRFLNETLPTTFSYPRNHTHDNDLEFYCYIKHIDRILPVTSYNRLSIPQTLTIKGSLNDAEGKYDLQFLLPKMNKGNAELQNLTFFMQHERKEALVGLSFTEHTVNYDSTQLRIGDINMSMLTQVRSDSLLSYILFDDVNNADDDNAGISINTHIGKHRRQPAVSVHILPSVFYMRDTVWTLADSHIRYTAADTALIVSDFDLHSASQRVSADGKASARMTDSIHIELEKINLPYFLQYVGINNAIAIDGLVSGWATLYALFSTPMFEANVSVPNAQLNYTSIGDLTATATLDRETHHILIEADAYRNGHHDVHLLGNVIPEDSYWELFINADGADLRLVNFWTEGFLSDIEGKGYGNLHVFGRRLNTWVTAEMYADSAALTIPFTGARYYLSDSIRMDTTNITFPAVHIRDAEGHTGIIRGEITHELFKDFKYHISGQVNNILALDIPYSSQEMYYGKVYASGVVDIKGDEQLTDINVYARTQKKTDFYLCVNTASDASDNSFIEFVDYSKPIYLTPLEKKEKEEKQTSSSKVKLSMVIDATPDATVHVMLDSHNGDGMVGRGEGNLRFTMDAGGDVRLFGTYTMLDGTFSYAVGNIIRRSFSIVGGSSVTWSGDPLSPVLNAAAKYKVTASLRDLFGNDLSQVATNRSSIPVECMLYITGHLFNPVLRFGIELPQSDEAIASQVKAVINSDEMLMRQVVYLLAFNHFFTPEYMQNTSSSVANETYSLLSSTVTGQINAWLSRLTDVVSVGFNFRTDGEGASASQEYETQFQLRPMDRLSINGNFGYRYNDLSNRPFYGDVDIEYSLTPNGKIRAKAFTHTVDKYSLKQANTVQGVGFIFRHDFNPKSKKQRKKE